jgi:hypothetical protein
MEIIIPILAFGSLYVASNHNNKRKRKSPFAETTDFPTQISSTGISNDDVDNTDTDLTKTHDHLEDRQQSAYTDKFFNGVHSAGAASDPTQNKYKSITGDMVGELLNHII